MLLCTIHLRPINFSSATASVASGFLSSTLAKLRLSARAQASTGCLGKLINRSRMISSVPLWVLGLLLPSLGSALKESAKYGDHIRFLLFVVFSDRTHPVHSFDLLAIGTIDHCSLSARPLILGFFVLRFGSRVISLAIAVQRLSGSCRSSPSRRSRTGISFDPAYQTRRIAVQEKLRGSIRPIVQIDLLLFSQRGLSFLSFYSLCWHSVGRAIT